jgi:aryl-alcohol dehydrogenase-like predicted oxidoreductase
MRYRKLGRTGIEVSEIGYGAWGIGGKQWKGGTDDEAVAALRRAFELGVNFIDTALAYGDGHSEELVGQVVKDAPHRVYIATKIPPKNRLWPSRPGIPIEDVFPADYIVSSTEESLRNLKVDTIDLQQLHVWNDAWTPSDEWRRGFEDLKKSGKVRFVGVSIDAHDPDSGLGVIRTELIDAVQVIYNIFDQTPEAKLFPLTIEHNIGVLARVPFDEGSLTGTINENTTFAGDEFRASYFRGDRVKEVMEHVRKLKDDIGDVRGTLPEVALRFCLSHPAVSTVIPGMRRVKNVEINSAVPDLGPLDDAVLSKLKKHAWDKDYYA